MRKHGDFPIETFEKVLSGDEGRPLTGKVWGLIDHSVLGWEIVGKKTNLLPSIHYDEVEDGHHGYYGQDDRHFVRIVQSLQ